MSDFLEIANRLDIVKSDRDTTYDKSLSKSRAISKIHYEFVIPRTVINLSALGVAQAGALVHQFNLTAPRAFRILKGINGADVTDSNKYCYLCVRYRVGETVYRYRLNVSGQSELEESLRSQFIVHAKDYTNQYIATNFVIEVWTQSDEQTSIDIGPFTITTGILRNPANVDETEDTIDVAQELTREDLDVPFNFFGVFEPLPTLYGNDGKWLTN